MKHIICLISLVCFISCSKANTTQEIIGEWQTTSIPVCKWTFQKGGILLVKGPTGIVASLNWKVIEGDILQTSEGEAKISIEKDRLTLKDGPEITELTRASK